jgi:hypothetical protein
LQERLWDVELHLTTESAELPESTGHMTVNMTVNITVDRTIAWDFL